MMVAEFMRKPAGFRDLILPGTFKLPISSEIDPVTGDLVYRDKNGAERVRLDAAACAHAADNRDVARNLLERLKAI